MALGELIWAVYDLGPGGDVPVPSWGLVLAAALFFVSWTFVLGPVRDTVDLSTLGGLVTLAYPVGDVVLVFLVVLVIRGTSSGDRLDV